MRKPWKTLRKNIPNKLHAGYGKYFDVLWQAVIPPGPDGKRVYGLTRYDPLQILIDKTQGDKESIYTIFHEYLHALSEIHDIQLTERQVVKMEKTFPYIYEFILTLHGKRGIIKKPRKRIKRKKK